MKVLMGISTNPDSYSVSVFRAEDGMRLIHSPLSFWEAVGKILFWSSMDRKELRVIIEDIGIGRIEDFLDIMEFRGIDYIRVKDLQNQLIDLEKDEKHAD